DAKPMMSNNFTERCIKLEARRSGTQTVVKFIEQLYGIKVRTNQGRLYVLLGLVKQIPEPQSYMLVEKQSKKFYSPYNFYPVNMSAKISNRDNLCVPTTHYLVNHVHVAQLYIELLSDIKECLVKHFKNKEHIIAAEKKNYIIHNGTRRRTTMKDLFRPIKNIQVPTTIGSSKNHGAKPPKSSQLFNSNDLQFNEAEKIYINENVGQELNIFEYSVLSEISTSQNEDAIECTDSYSIHRHNTTRIRNKH
ncbi:6054_t:CDS:2, partial [Gigaspora rosea]